MKKITFLLFLLWGLSLSAQNIVINEIITSNSSVNQDEDGSYQDWVELYNNGPAAVNLDGYGLSDDPLTPFKWVFPAVTVNPGEFLLVFCSDKNRVVVGQPLHTNWKISSDGETITLTIPGGAIADQVPPAVIAQNTSWGRLPDGTGAFENMITPTPGLANQGGTSNPVLDAPTFSHVAGFYPADFTLTLSAEPGATILYTLDGSEPDENNLGGTTYQYKTIYPENPGDPFGPFFTNTYQTLTYSAPIVISDRTSQPNKLTGISSTYDANPDYFPGYNVFKGTVVRVKAIMPGSDPSPVVTRNYFVSPQGTGRYSIPVISLSINEDKLFDYENGIYVAGKLFDDYRIDNPTDVPDYPIGNYTQKGSGFERRANFSYFVNGQQVLNQDIGIRVQGNYSRIYPNKSLNFYSRQEFGADKMNYKFFDDRDDLGYTRVVAKNGGSDYFNSFIKDALCAELLENINTVSEASQPAVTFINGEYWGMLTIREKYDDKFFKRKFDIPENEIELLENDGYQVEEGDNPHYLAMADYIANNSLVPEANYSYLKTQMDTESFTDYFITNIYLNNTDWPGNNIVFWRRNTAYTPGAPYGNDGRWRWAAHDMTATFSNPNHNNLAVATEPGGTDWPNPDWSTLQLRKLLENDTFKHDFITRFADLMNTTFLPSRVVAMVDEMKAEIEAEMPEQMPRWKGPEDLGDWNYFLNQERNFANNRPAPQRDQIRAKFGIAGNINATVDVSDVAHGFVKVNTIDIKQGTDGILAANPYPWTGIYFSDIPVKLKAEALPGYMFSHWTGDSNSTDAEITITSAVDFSVTAVFIPSGFSIEESEPIYFWWMSGAIPNDTPLLALNSSYEITADASIDFQSAFGEGYPFINGHPNWRKASMERRNKPTPINYRPDANNDAPYVAGDMKGLQITQPFQDNGLENTMVFNLSTAGYKDIKLSFAAMDENAAEAISVDYSVSAGEPIWITTGLSDTSLPLATNTFQLYEIDFSAISTTVDNANFKVRLRFTGPNMTAAAGNRVTFNNIALDGVRLPLIYPSPNVYTVGMPIADLVPQVAANVTAYSITGLPAGLSFDTVTGIISGTPTDVTPLATYTVTATNPGGSVSFGILITVNAVAPSDLSYNSPNVYTVGTMIADLIPTVTGTVDSYSIAPALPDGLSLDVSTGIISGTPTVVTPLTTYLVTATNTGGNTSFPVIITVNDVAPVDLSYPNPNVFTVGTAIANLTPTVTGTVDGYSITPALPDGLSLDATTGIISGTPNAVSAATAYTVTAANTGGTVAFEVVITVNAIAPMDLSYPNPNVFTVGTAIANLTPTVTGTVDGYSITPALPDGLSLDVSTGIISGTPNATSPNTTYLITASNTGGSTAFALFITINAIAPTELSYVSPNVYTVGTAIADLTPAVVGEVDSYTVWPTLPDGLSLDATTGIISGTPSAVTPLTTYLVTATNTGGNTSFPVIITINAVAPLDLVYDSPNVYTVGTTIANLAPSVTGDVESYAVSPSLPAGLSLDVNTGVISGTPTVVTPLAAYTVTATNTGGNTSFPVIISVNDVAPTGLSYDTPTVVTVNTPLTLVPAANGNISGYTLNGTLPVGVVFDSSTGIISGTPTVVMPETTYTVTASNSGGSISFVLTIAVIDVAPAALSYPSPNLFNVGEVIASLMPTVNGNVVGYSVWPALPDGLSLDATTGIISGTPTTVTPETIYTVTATNSGGSVTFDVVITVDEELSAVGHRIDHFVVYPNPFYDRIYVKGINGKVDFSLFSADGKLIRQGQTNQSELMLPDLPNGIYLLRLSADGVQTVKIVKQ
ncbi:putative Ig domain-containing protein [Flavobacterium caeni]|uniref:Por secretion system C-terminal sorting domain-containing protein n=1 Tax=Flavobacterium caeni TaxID=490189 RepID=A0A1G5JD46_9FLAO|nr:putative Ig domain-containing protein [Flavobacterium caeni]SCY85628.1 Por secretion system C-terminal sorting domain-containing protein [Flavobacterium caeni]